MGQQAYPDVGALRSKTAQHGMHPAKPKPAKPPKSDQSQPAVRLVGFEDPTASPPPSSSPPLAQQTSQPLPSKPSRLVTSTSNANSASSLPSGALAQNLAQQPPTVGPPPLFPGMPRARHPGTAAAQMPATTVQLLTKQASTSSTEAMEDTRDVSASPVLLTFAGAKLSKLLTSHPVPCDASPPASSGPSFSDLPLAEPPAARSPSRPSISHSSPAHLAGHHQPAPCTAPTSPSPPAHLSRHHHPDPCTAPTSPSPPAHLARHHHPDPCTPPTSQSSPAPLAGLPQCDTCTAPCEWLSDSKHQLPLPASPASSPIGTPHTESGSEPSPLDVKCNPLASVDEHMQLRRLLRGHYKQQLTDTMAAAAAGVEWPVTPIRQDTVTSASPTPFNPYSPAAPTLQHATSLRLFSDSPLSAPPTTTSPHRTYHVSAYTPYSPHLMTSSFAPLARVAGIPANIGPINALPATPMASYHQWSEVGFPHIYRSPQVPSPPARKAPVDEYDALKHAPPLLDHDRRLFCEAIGLYKSLKLSKASLEALYALWEPYRLPNGEYRGINHNKAIADICNAKKAQDLRRQLRRGDVPPPRQSADPRTRWWHGRHDGGFADALSPRAPSCDAAAAARTGSPASRVLTSFVGAARKLFGC